MNAKMQNMVKIAMNKSLLKEYNVNGKRVVYLNDGDEFQIQIFNPHPFRIGASIKFNNSFSSTSTRKLVINPGERIWLERYLDDDKKLCFNTYWVDKDNSVVEKAITDNGKISIEFYKEQEFKPITYTTYEPHIYYNTITSPPKPYYYDFTVGDNHYTNTTADLKANAPFCQPASEQNSALNATATAASTTAPWTSTWTSTMTDVYSPDDLANKFLKNGKNSCINNPKPKRQKRQKETGRIEKGKHSYQHFDEISLNLEPFAFEWETLYIMPSSEKPITGKDLQKRYCPQCGRKVKEKFKFCPFCGEKL